MESKKKKIVINKYVVILAIIGLLLSMLVPITYAFFTASVQGNNLANPNVIESGTMRLVFSDGNVVGTTSDWVPGTSLTKSFTVENTGTLPASYSVFLEDIINTFADKSDLVYEIVGSTSGENTPYSTSSQIQAPIANSKIIDNQTINAGELHTYTLTLRFLSKNENQDDNQGKTFSGKLRLYDTHNEPHEEIDEDLEEIRDYYLISRSNYDGFPIVEDDGASYFDIMDENMDYKEEYKSYVILYDGNFNYDQFQVPLTNGDAHIVTRFYNNERHYYILYNGKFFEAQAAEARADSDWIYYFTSINFADDELGNVFRDRSDEDFTLVYDDTNEKYVLLHGQVHTVTYYDDINEYHELFNHVDMYNFRLIWTIDHRVYVKELYEHLDDYAYEYYYYFDEDFEQTKETLKDWADSLTPLQCYIIVDTYDIIDGYEYSDDNGPEYLIDDNYHIIDYTSDYSTVYFDFDTVSN